MKPTIKDIARIAGVNHSTVSRCLNDSPLVSNETKEKIKKIAEEVGFEFNASARSLSTRKTYTIGIITSDFFDDLGAGQFFSTFVKNILENLENNGYDAIFKFPYNNIGESNIKKMINRNKIDGLIIMHNNISSDDLAVIKKSGIPSVCLHTKPKDFDKSNVDFFMTDHFAGGYSAAKYLFEKGYRKYTVITSMPGEMEFFDRTEGFKKYMTENGVKDEDIEIIWGEISFEYGKTAAKKYKDKLVSTGVFVQADIIASGMVSELKDIKLGMVGYDDIPMSRLYGITTIHQPVDILSKMAVERIIELLKKENTAIISKIIKPELIIRET